MVNRNSPVITLANIVATQIPSNPESSTKSYEVACYNPSGG